MWLAWILGAGAAGVGYGLARRSGASKGKALALGAATGVAGGAATAVALAVLSAVWPVALLGGAGYLGYRYATRQGDRSLDARRDRMLGSGDG
ncbi:MAG: hypothetical protein D6705_16275 [Deltaproteobacteria bacterium]|nr:MAG: hypothetical protein D6705_16275 [Deltaproteobacteria bacterium]